MSFEHLTQLYAQVDTQSSALSEHHKDRLQCKQGCAQCCVDDLSVFQIEADHIRKTASRILEQAPHQAGMCAFLDDAGSCRIYDQRPYVCRTQGLPLRWLEEDEEDGALVEYRDICPLNEEGEPLETLGDEHCWTIGPVEGQLAQLQHQYGQGKMNRVPLRKLFASE